MRRRPLRLSRAKVLAFRRRAGHLDQRLPLDRIGLGRAALAGLQDSAPRAALLSLHARLHGVEPATWEHPALVQVWGPRFNDYVVAARDAAVFTLGRLPSAARARTRAVDTAARLAAFLAGRRLPFGHAGRDMGVPANSLRYATLTGTVRLRWDGARQPVIWTMPAPRMPVDRARQELARRYLRVFGPGTAEGFSRWAGVALPDSRAAFAAIAPELIPTYTPAGDGWLLADDEAAARVPVTPGSGVRLLPGGDPYLLLWGPERELLVPNARERAALWTTRVWPGALLVDGAVAGTWRRAAHEVSIDLWRRLSRADRALVEHEAATLPLGLSVPIRVTWV